MAILSLVSSSIASKNHWKSFRPAPFAWCIAVSAFLSRVVGSMPSCG